jgi:predicted transcriptional regulator
LASLKKWEEKKMTEMRVSSLMSKNVVIAYPKESLSKVISKISSSSIHETPVVDEKKMLLGYFGFELLSRKKNVSLQTKIEKLMVTSPKIIEGDNVFNAAKILLETGFRAAPVTDANNYLRGVISRTDIIKSIPKLNVLENETSSDLMTSNPNLLDLKDDIEKAVKFMNELGELAAPVVDKYGKIMGSVLMGDISKSIWNNEKGQNIGETVGERNKPKIEVRSFISPVGVVKEDTKIKEIAQKMIDINPYICVVSNKFSEPLGVITQYDMLERLIQFTPERGIFVNFTGLKITDTFVYSSMISKVERFVEKVGKYNWISPYSLNIHVVTHEKGGRNKWSLRSKFSSDKGVISVKTFGWDMLKSVDVMLEELNKKITRLKPR